MPTNLQIRRGLQSALPTGLAGEPLFTTDTKRLYISDGTATNLLQGAATLLTTGAIPFSDANGKLTMSASNLYWDNTNSRLGIGTATPSVLFHANGNGIIGASTTSGFFFNTANDTMTLSTFRVIEKSGASILFGQSQTTTMIRNNGSEAIRIPSTNNVLIGTTTDAGFKLDVNGTARVVGDSIIQGSNSLSGANALLIRNTNSLHGLSVTNNAEVRIGRNQLFTFSDTSTGGYVFSIAASNSGISFTNTALGSRPVSFSMNTGEVLRIHQSYTAIVTNSFLVGTTTDVSSSILTIASTTKGFLPPRMTNAQRLAIATPAVGLIVYCTDAVEGLYINKSTGWTFVI